MSSPTLTHSLHLFACLLLLGVIGCYRPITHPLPAGPPSAAQIEQIMQVERVQEIWATTHAPTEANVRSTLLAMAQQQHFSAQQQQQLDARMDQIMAAIRQEITWEKAEPLYKQAYARHFNGDEIQAFLDWRSSSAGQAYLAFTQRTNQNPELRGNPVRLAAAMGQELSTDELAALRQAAGGLAKSAQVTLEIMQALHLQRQQVISLVLQREMPELLGQD